MSLLLAVHLPFSQNAASYIALEARVLVGLVLLVSSWSKLSDFSETRRGFAEYGLRPSFANLAAWTVPALELGVGLSLAVGLAVTISGILAAALLTIFTAFAFRAVLFGGPADCHCFGGWLRERLGWQTVARNFVLIFLSCIAALTPAPMFTVENAINHQSGYIASSAAGLLPAFLIATAVLIAYAQVVRALDLELPDSMGPPARNRGNIR